MAFEFLGKAFRGATNILGGLADEVGNGRANREDDVLKAKRAFGALGRYEEPEDGANGFTDRPFDTAIRGFQRDKGLRVDGFMRPAGPTERSLQDDVLGALRQKNDGFGRDRDNGLNWFRVRSLSPAASLLDERDSGLDRLDLGRDRNGRGGSFALVDLGKHAASASRAGNPRPGRNDTASDDRLSQQGRDRLASRSGDARPDGG
jgi:hypothetical protein